MKVPSDDVQRDATGETWMGMRVAAWQWEVENNFGTMTRNAMHWSTAPTDAERLYRENDIRALLARYGNVSNSRSEIDTLAERVDSDRQGLPK